MGKVISKDGTAIAFDKSGQGLHCVLTTRKSSIGRSVAMAHSSITPATPRSCYLISWTAMAYPLGYSR